MILLLLSWCIVFCVMLYPWLSKKYLVQKIWERTSSTQINSASVKFLAFIFCFQEIIVIALHQAKAVPQFVLYIVDCVRGIHIPVDHSNMQVSGKYYIPFKYLRTPFHFPKPTLSGYFTHVVRHATRVCMSCCTQALMKIIMQWYDEKSLPLLWREGKVSL